MPIPGMLSNGFRRWSAISAAGRLSPPSCTDDITVEFQPDHTGHIPCHGAYPGGLIARYGLTDHLFEMLRLPIIRGETRNPDRRWGRPS